MARILAADRPACTPGISFGEPPSEPASTFSTLATLAVHDPPLGSSCGTVRTNLESPKMSPFAIGALGALAVLLTAAILRRAAWRLHLRHLHGGPLPLRHLFRRLGTRPDQEQVISAEADGIAAELRALRGDVRTVREEVAALLAAPTTDAASFRAAIEARLARLAALQARVSEGMARIHAALDPSQRATLASWVREGPHRCRHGRCHA
jgi:Spy/CpxP family protein refolding chaperone